MVKTTAARGCPRCLCSRETAASALVLLGLGNRLAWAKRHGSLVGLALCVLGCGAAVVCVADKPAQPRTKQPGCWALSSTLAASDTATEVACMLVSRLRHNDASPVRPPFPTSLPALADLDGRHMLCESLCMSAYAFTCKCEIL